MQVHSLTHVCSLLASQDYVRIFESPLWTSLYLDVSFKLLARLLPSDITAIISRDVKQSQEIISDKQPRNRAFL